MNLITKTLSVVLLGLSIATPSFAAENADGESATYVKPGKVYDDVASGVTIGISKDFTEASFNGNSFDTDQVFGISIGYQDINVRDIGWSTRFKFNTFEDADDTYGLRVDGNMTYGFTDMFFGFGGLNLSTYTLPNTDMTPGLGIQLGAGVQISPNFGVQLAYSQLNTKAEDINVKTDGIELGLVGTF